MPVLCCAVLVALLCLTFVLHRALCTPAFSSGNLVLVANTTVENANTLFAHWDKQTIHDESGQAFCDVRVDEAMTKVG